MFHVDESRGSALALRFGDDMQAESRLSGGFGPENFGHARAWDAADAEGQIERKRSGWNRLDLHVFRFAEAHDRAFAVPFGYVRERFVEEGALCLAVHVLRVVDCFF